MDGKQYIFQPGNPLGFAVQLRLTPELKQALVNARSVGESVSLRFREEPHREAVLSVGSTEYCFGTAPAAGQLEVLELAPKQRSAAAVAAVRQRLTLQRAPECDARPRGLAGSLAGGLPEDRKKRSAVLLDGGQRGAGMHPRVTTTTEVVTRAAQLPSQAAPSANGTTGRSSGNGMAPLAGGSGLRPAAAPRAGGSEVPLPPRKPLEPPKPRSQQPGAAAAPKPRKAPTPPPPAVAADGAAAPAQPAGAEGAAGRAAGGGGSGGGAAAGSGGSGGNSPVGYGSGGSGGGAAAAGAASAGPTELPRAAVLAARRGDLPLVVAALLRDQPLTASSLASRIDTAYRAAGAKPEAREYVRRVVDNCCAMAANRMQLKPDVAAREAPRLEELMASGGSGGSGGASPVGAPGANSPGRPDAPERGRVMGRAGSGRAAQGQGPGKRVASCSPDPRLSPDFDSAAVGGGGGGSGGGADVSMGGDEEDDGGNAQPLSQSQPAAAPPRANGSGGGGGGSAGVKRQKTGANGAGGAAAGQQPKQKQRRDGVVGGGGGGGSLGDGYDDFDDLAEPVPAAKAKRDASAGRPMGQAAQAGRATAAKTAAKTAPGAPAGAQAPGARRPVVAPAPGGPRGLPMHGTATPPPPPVAMAPASAAPAVPAPAAAPSGVPPRPRAALGSGGGGGGGGTEGGSQGTVSGAVAGRVVALRTASEDLTAGAGSRGGAGSESQVDTEGRRGTPVPGVSNAGAASPDYESPLDPEMQAYADLDLNPDVLEDDKDAELYRGYVDWKPAPHAAVRTAEQYEQYEREYRSKYEVYHRLNLKYGEVVREAEAQRAAVDEAHGSEERHRCVMALWRLGASKWRLIEVWKRARRNLHADLTDLRDRVAEYVSRSAAAMQ